MNNLPKVGFWIRRFLIEHLIAERNLSENTQWSYRDSILLLLRFARDYQSKPLHQLLLEDLSASMIRSFLDNLEKHRSCSIATRNQRLASLHSLARFVAERSPEHIAWCESICAIDFKKAPHSVMDYLDKTEMDALLACAKERHPQNARNHALLLFLYNSGARASEAARLTLGDLHLLSPAYARIHGKGNKERLCPLWPNTTAEIRCLAGNRPQNDHVFLNRCGHPMTRFGIHTVLERLVSAAKDQVPSLKRKRVSPHTIRHTTAMHLLWAGVDINTIRAWLGHVSIDTTLVYAEVDLQMKRKALAACEPSSRISPRKSWKENQDLMSFLRNL